MHSAASDLGLHCLSMYHKKDARLKRVILYLEVRGAQWLSGRELDSRPRGRGVEPHRRHCVVVLEKDIFILA